jgi:hypothetical protein
MVAQLFNTNHGLKFDTKKDLIDLSMLNIDDAGDSRCVLFVVLFCVLCCTILVLFCFVPRVCAAVLCYVLWSNRRYGYTLVLWLMCR